RLHKNGLLIANIFRNALQIFDGKRQIFCKRAVMADDPKDGPSRTMRFETALAKTANWAIAERRARNIDLARHPRADPRALHPFGDSRDFNDLSHKLMSGSSAKPVIAAKNLDIRIANASQAYSNQCPSGGHARQGNYVSDKLSIL